MAWPVSKLPWKKDLERLSWHVTYLNPSSFQLLILLSTQSLVLCPVPEVLTRASCRKDWKRISAESSLMSPRWPSWSREWSELNWTDFGLLQALKKKTVDSSGMSAEGTLNSVCNALQQDWPDKKIGVLWAKGARILLRTFTSDRFTAVTPAIFFSYALPSCLLIVILQQKSR